MSVHNFKCNKIANTKHKFSGTVSVEQIQYLGQNKKTKILDDIHITR